MEHSIKNELGLLLRQAEAHCDEVKYTPAAENQCDKKRSSNQIDFSPRQNRQK